MWFTNLLLLLSPDGAVDFLPVVFASEFLFLLSKLFLSPFMSLLLEVFILSLLLPF